MKTLRWLISVSVFSALMIGGYLWWLHSQRYPATSDAYIGAHVVRIAPQVGGKVAELPVTDHARVARGQLLLAIDPESCEIAVKRAEANVALADQAQAGAQAAVDAARAEVSEREAEHDDALRNNERMQELLKQKSVAQAQADTTRYKLREATAALEDARSGLQQAVRELGEAGARVRVADAALAHARLDLSHTHITAPVSGVLGTLDVRPGDVVTAGQQLFPLVDDSTTWVDANYKETDLHRIRIGQSASISVDMYPGKLFHGHVESVGPASSVAFSLLPPENATGNWVKVTQRFPVRVRIDKPDPAIPLRLGASCTVTIDTTGSGGAGGKPVGGHPQVAPGNAVAS
jgi:membrane fusion protein (multidrug efflux system)